VLVFKKAFTDIFLAIERSTPVSVSTA